MPHLSNAVYVGLCQKVGTQSEVRIRREVVDTGRDVVRNTSIIIMTSIKWLAGVTGRDSELNNLILIS